MTTRSALSASRRIAVRTFRVSRRIGSERAVTCWRANAASACSAWARTASVTPAGTRCITTTVAPCRLARASANRSASSAWGPPRTGTRIRRISRAPRCLTTAMSHGDSRTTSSMVGEMTGVPPIPVGRGLAAPAEDHEVGFLLGRRLHDPRGRVPPDAHQRVDGGPLGHVVHDLLEEAARLAGPRGALGEGHALRHLHDAEGGELPGPWLQQGRADPDQLLGGERVGDRDEDPGRQRLAAHCVAPPGTSRRRRPPDRSRDAARPPAPRLPRLPARPSAPPGTA